MKENGYINVTKLCSEAMETTDSKKPFYDWLRNDSNKKLVKEFSSDPGNSGADLLIPITTGSKKLTIIRGTYAHPDLVPHIASWASPKFALKVSKIVNEYLIKEVVLEKDRQLGIKDEKIDKLNEKVDKLLVKNDTISKKNDKILKKNDKILKKNDKMNDRIKRLLVKNDELYELNEEILEKLNNISNDRVVSTGNPNDTSILVIVKNNHNLEEHEGETVYDYHALRILKKSYNSSILKYQRRNPNMEIILKIDFSPNSINLWKRITTELAKSNRPKILYNGTNFDLARRFTEEDLVAKIIEIHNERLNHGYV